MLKFPKRQQRPRLTRIASLHVLVVKQFETNILLRRPHNVALPKPQGSQPPQVVLDSSSRPLYFVLSTLKQRQDCNTDNKMVESMLC